MSELRADTITASDGTSPVTLTKQSAAKAWVNFNGTGTIAARDSLNLSSLTDNGTGLYTKNFSSSFGNANYTTCCSGGNGNQTLVNVSQPQVDAPPTTSSIRLCATYQNSVNYDPAFVGSSEFGDLA